MNISGIANFGLQAVNPLAAPAGGNVPTIGSNGFAPAGMGRMDQLVQLIKDFSSAEVMTALMMTHAQRPEPAAHAHGSSIAMATWGLAQATQMAGMGAAAGAAFAGMSAMGAAGAQISVQA